MIINEFKRILARPQGKALLIFIFVSFLLSGFNIQTSSDYNDTYTQYVKDTSKFFKANEQVLIDYNDGTSYFWDQANYINVRDENIEDRITQIKAKKETGLFDSLSDQKRLNQELVFYEKLSDENIEMQQSYQVDKVLNDNTFRYLIPLVSGLLIMLIFSEDIENETLSLFMTTKKSLSKLFMVKSFVFLTLMASMVSLLIFTTLFRTDFSNIPIHSLFTFKDVMGNYTILGFVIKESIHLLINSILLGYGLLSLFIIFKNQAMSFIAMLSLYFVEAVLYLYIPVNSGLAYLKYLKYLNIYYLTFVNRLEFLVINNSIYFCTIVVLLFVMVFAYLLYRIYKRWDISINKGIPLRTTNLTLQSIYQLLINYRGILMIIVVLMFSFYNIQGFSLFTRPEEASYQLFKKDYIGEITLDLEHRINKDDVMITEAYQKSLVLRDYINKHSEKANELYAENDHIFKMANNYENIKKLKAEVLEAKKLDVKALVDTRATDLLFMKGQTFFIVQHLAVLFLPIIIFGLYQGLHSFSALNLSLVKSSKLGLKPYLRSQRIGIISLSFTSVLVILGLHIFKVVSNLPIVFSNSLKQQMILNLDIPLWLGLLLLYFTLSLILSATGIIAQTISRSNI